MKDPGLRRCSHAAKGVLMDMLCLMFECEERGVLATAGRAWADSEIAQAVGGDSRVTLPCVVELIEKAVIHRNDSGAIYSRRLVRDEHKRRLCSAAGKLGGGNPKLTFIGGPKGQAKGASKGQPTPSSSASSSTAVLRTVAAQPAADKPQQAERKQRKQRVLTEDQENTRREFGDWWISAEYPRRHNGHPYEFQGGRDAEAVLKLLRNAWVAWDLEKAKAVARFFMDQPEVHAGSHQLYTLGLNPGFWIRKLSDLQQGKVGSYVIRNNGHAPPGGAQFIGARRPLPEVVAG